MELPKVSIDLPLVMDPYKLASVLSGLDVLYSEIMVPDTLRFIEVWNKNMQPITIYTFEEDPLEWQKFFGLSGNSVSQNNFIAGLALLNRAHKKGMVSMFDSDDYVKDGQAFLETDGFFNQFYTATTVDKFTVNTDMPTTLEGMLGYELHTSTKAIFGDLYFADYLRKLGIYEDVKTAANVAIDHHTDLFLKTPEGNSVEELMEFILQKQFFENSFAKISKANSSETRRIDMALTTAEFISTTALDAVAFKGFPISSGVVLCYKLGSRYFKKKG